MGGNTRQHKWFSFRQQKSHFSYSVKNTIYLSPSQILIIVHRFNKNIDTGCFKIKY